METRKLIKFGKNSYIVSLPKDWVEQNKLDKGAEVYLDQSPANITILPKEILQEERSITISCHGRSCNEIITEITSAYKAGYNTIIIEGKHLQEHLSQIREHIHNLAGAEIIEQNLNNIIVRDMLDVRQIQFSSLIGRMDMMVRSMFIDILQEEGLGNKVLRDRDRDLNRVQYLVARAMRQMLRNPAISNTLQTTIIEAYYLENISWALERIGDYLKRVNDDIQRSTPPTREKLKELLKQQYEFYLATMKAYNKKSRADAANIHSKLIAQLGEYTNKIHDAKERDEILALENIKNISRDMRIILRATIEFAES